MASQISTPNPAPLSQNRAAVLQSWADLNVDLAALRPIDDILKDEATDDIAVESPPLVGKAFGAEPPVPTVRLSRLIEPAPPILDLVDPETDVIDLRPADSGPQPWANSAGRPLFHIGLAALVAATAVGAYTFAPLSQETLTDVEPVIDSAEGDPVTPGSLPSGAAAPSEESIGIEQQRLIDLYGAQTSGQGADLALVGMATSDGDVIQWTATVRNQGPGVADQPVRVIQTLPANVDYVSSFGDNWDCLFSPTADTITCDLGEELGIDQRRQLGIVTTDGDAEAGTRLSATLAVVGRNSDTDLSNNTINVVAVIAEDAAEGEGDSSRSSESGAASEQATSDQAGSDETASDEANDETSEQMATGAVTELPKTGAGLTILLAAAGLVMCLAGRRLLTLSDEIAPIAIASRLGS